MKMSLVEWELDNKGTIPGTNFILERHRNGDKTWSYTIGNREQTWLRSDSKRFSSLREMMVDIQYYIGERNESAVRVV